MPTIDDTSMDVNKRPIIANYVNCKALKADTANVDASARNVEAA